MASVFILLLSVMAFFYWPGRFSEGECVLEDETQQVWRVHSMERLQGTYLMLQFGGAQAGRAKTFWISSVEKGKKFEGIDCSE